MANILFRKAEYCSACFDTLSFPFQVTILENDHILVNKIPILENYVLKFHPKYKYQVYSIRFMCVLIYKTARSGEGKPVTRAVNNIIYLYMLQKTVITLRNSTIKTKMIHVIPQIYNNVSTLIMCRWPRLPVCVGP